MKVVLLVVSAVALVYGVGTFLLSKSAIHEIEALLSLLFSLIAFIGAAALSRLDRLVKNGGQRNPIANVEGFFEKPEDMPSGEYEERFVRIYGVVRDGTSFLLGKDSFERFDDVVEAVRKQRQFRQTT